MVGNELVRYRDISATEPWVLQDCIRGAFGTKAQSHSKGDSISKLMDHGYKVFLPDINLQNDIATNIANLYNETALNKFLSMGWKEVGQPEWGSTQHSYL